VFQPSLLGFRNFSRALQRSAFLLCHSREGGNPEFLSAPFANPQSGCPIKTFGHDVNVATLHVILSEAKNLYH
jgi:hypothetical protein